LERFFESKGDVSCVKRYLQQHAAKMRAGRFSLQDYIFHGEVRPREHYRGLGSLAAQVARRMAGPWPSGERVSYVVVERPPGARIGDFAVPPGEVVGGRFMSSTETNTWLSKNPHYLNIEYYLQQQIAPALNRLFVLIRGRDGAPGCVDVRRWFLEGPRPRRRDANIGGQSSALQRLIRSGVCEACGCLANQQHGSVTLCTACSRGEGVPRLAEVMRDRQRWEARLQRCGELCVHCSGSALAAADCQNFHCDIFARKCNAQVQLTGLVGGSGWLASLDAW